MQEFGLSPEETKIMFSYQYHLVEADIRFDTDSQNKSTKTKWLNKWKESTEFFLKSLIEQSNTSNFSFKLSDISSKLITNFEDLKKISKNLISNPTSGITRYLILVELASFQPYYKLGDANDEKFSALKIYDTEKLTRKIESFATELGIEASTVRRFQSNYKEALNGIKGGWNPWMVGVFGSVILAVVAAFATPLIAGLLASILVPGLSGAAAVSAVLAALGGGAIAAGGFGMAGGMAVIVAGGAILGAGAGVGAGSLFTQSPDIALTQAAKLEVVMKEIIHFQKDIRLAQEIIKEQRQAIRSLEDKLDQLVGDKEKNQKEIENLKKAIEILKKALGRNQDLL